MSNLLLPSHDLLIPEQEHEAQGQRHEIDRREATKLLAILAGAAVAPGSANKLFAKEDFSKLSAGERLEKMPDKIPLSGGKFADVEKCPTIAPTQLALIIQTYHYEHGYIEPKIKHYLDRSRAESAEVVVYCHEELGINHHFLEGYTYEEYVFKLLHDKPNLNPKEKALLESVIRTMKKYRHTWSDQPFDEKLEADRINYNLRENLPPGIYDKIESGELDITILPAETERVYSAAMEDKLDGDGLFDRWVTEFNREDVNVNMCVKNQKAFKVCTMQWPPGHWKKVRNEREGTLPWRMYELNVKGKGSRICAAYVRTPTVIEVEKLRKEGKIDFSIKPGKR